MRYFHGRTAFLGHYDQECRGLCVTPAAVWKCLEAESLVWKRRQHWFQVTVDAAFVAKREHSTQLSKGGRSACTTVLRKSCP